MGSIRQPNIQKDGPKKENSYFTCNQIFLDLPMDDPQLATSQN